MYKIVYKDGTWKNSLCQVFYNDEPITGEMDLPVSSSQIGPLVRLLNKKDEEIAELKRLRAKHYD